jgi:hypothetical protein
VDLELVNGHHIYVRFDLPSCGTTGHAFDVSFILAHYSDIILDGKGDMGIDRVKEIARAIADALNLKKEVKGTEIYRQANLSMDVQWALSIGDKRKALTHLDDLLNTIGDYPEAQPLWSDWLHLAVKLATIGSSPE